MAMLIVGAVILGAGIGAVVVLVILAFLVDKVEREDKNNE